MWAEVASNLRTKGMSSTSIVVSLITIPFNTEAVSYVRCWEPTTYEDFRFELNFQTEVKASPLPWLIYKNLY